MARYSDIRRGAQLNNALTNYVNYISTPRIPGVNTRGPVGPKRAASVEPYARDTVVALVSVRGASAQPIEARLVTARQAALTVPADAAAVKLAGFSPARVITNTGARTVATGQSAITQQRYLQYTGLTYQNAPFGRDAATDDYGDAINLLRADLLSFFTTAIKRVSFQAEKLRAS